MKYNDCNRFLEIYEIEVEHFDLDTFEEDLMNLPYEIETIGENLSKLNDEQQRKYFHINSKLSKLIKRYKPKNHIQKWIVKKTKEKLSKYPPPHP